MNNPDTSVLIGADYSEDLSIYRSIFGGTYVDRNWPHRYGNPKYYRKDFSAGEGTCTFRPMLT